MDYRSKHNDIFEYSNGETSLQYFEEYLQPDALYLLDEPEVSLSPANKVALAEEINKYEFFKKHEKEFE